MPEYPEILKQLSSDEVLLLDAIAENIRTAYWYPNVPVWKPVDGHVSEWRAALRHRRTGLEIDALLQNIARLGLIEINARDKSSTGTNPLDESSAVHLTELGIYFLQACREPRESNALFDQILLLTTNRQ